MIEKLSEYKITSRDGSFINVECNTKIINTLVRKINEIIELLNAIVVDVDSTKCIDGGKAPADNSEKANCQEKVADRMIGCTTLDIPESYKTDPFAHQRQWIGKLCKFWDYDDEEKWFSILEHIDKNSPYTYCASGDWWYKHCEPVKPDDDIIYKGE